MSDEAAQGHRGGTYNAIIPYLTVADAAGLISFLEAAFGATRQFIMPEPDGKIRHAEIRLGDSLLMLSDGAAQSGAPIDLCHYVADVDAVFARALAAGARPLAEPETKPYGDRTAGIADPAGNSWWICARIS